MTDKQLEQIREVERLLLLVREQRVKDKWNTDKQKILKDKYDQQTSN